ncbi:hypothetical protein [Tomitella gaofuii]|nr:hypothetical protein [Tomitella gaofuii]
MTPLHVTPAPAYGDGRDWTTWYTLMRWLAFTTWTRTGWGSWS